MKLVVFNGSPRRKASNSKILMDRFLSGFSSATDDAYEVHYLMDVRKNQEHLQAFDHADYILIIFPLYTDSMPGIVKYFFETLATRTFDKGKKLGFIVQSGFPEAKHSVYVARYLERFALIIHCRYLGTVIIGGVEGIQVKPAFMTKKLYSRFRRLGCIFAANNTFDPKIMAKLRKPNQFHPVSRWMFSVAQSFGLPDYYWNMKLKEHQAYSKRFDQPYLPE